MAVGLELRIDQIPVYADFESPSIRRHQRERFDIVLEFIQQFGCQTDSPVSVVSNSAIYQLKIICHLHSSNYRFD